MADSESCSSSNADEAGDISEAANVVNTNCINASIEKTDELDIAERLENSKSVDLK